jgi:hypothetical protein
MVLLVAAVLATAMLGCSESTQRAQLDSGVGDFRTEFDASVGIDAGAHDASVPEDVEPPVGDAGDNSSLADEARIADGSTTYPFDSGAGGGDSHFVDVNVAIQVVDVSSHEPITEYVDVRYRQRRGSESVYLPCADSSCQAWHITEPIRGDVIIIAGYLAPAEDVNCDYVSSQSMPLRVDPKVRQEVVFELSTTSLGCEN